MEHRLAAVLISDIVDYTKLMEVDTDGTVGAWSKARDDIIEPTVTINEGRIVKFTGDGFLAEFKTIQKALETGIELQNRLSNNILKFRMAVNLGDIVDDGRDIHGEGINIAARLEGLSEPGGIVISGDVYNQVKNRIDAEYKDLGPQEVKNVAEPVQAFSLKFENLSPKSDKVSAQAEQVQASIAVLPFDNMSGDSEQEYFCDGITEDLITSLSTFKFLKVIARNSTFQYKGESPDVRDVAKEMGVRYVLEGSVRKSGDRVRINAQLLDGESGAHIWAQKYDRGLEDIFAVQDEIVNTVTAEMSPALRAFEQKRSLKLSPEQLSAWELGHRAFWHFFKYTISDLEETVRLAEMGLERDPDLSVLWAIKGAANSLKNVMEIKQTNPEDLENIKHAAKLDPADPMTQSLLGSTYMQFGQTDLAIKALETALKFNPNLHHALMSLGWLLVWLDEYERARKTLTDSLAVSPADPLNGRKYVGIALSYLGEENYDEAINWIDQSMSLSVFWPAKLFQISIYFYSGKEKEAKELLAQFRQYHPDLTITNWQETVLFMRGKLADMLLKGLKEVGLPE